MTNDEKLPRIRPLSGPMDVPVFNVILYVSLQDDKVLARAANLPDLQCSAATEPMALKSAITEAKARLGKWHGAGEDIPWIEPVPPPRDGEQQRLVPVHL